MFASGFPVIGSFSAAPAEILDSNMLLKLSTLSLLIWHSLWVIFVSTISLLVWNSRWMQPKHTWSRNDVGSSKSTSFICASNTGVKIFVSSKPFFISSTHTDKNSPFSQNLLLNRSLETVPSLHWFGSVPTWQYCLYSHVWWMKEIKRDNRLSHALVHFVIDRASLFTDHRMSGLPIRVKYKHLRTIWEHTFDNSPTDFNSSSFKWWSSMHGIDSCWVGRDTTIFRAW